jgi:hypothetical protein
MKNKKYRLIKKYPGSLELGTIIYINDDKCYCDKSGGLLGEKDIVLNYPEFWGEIVEKNYEILSFRQTNCSGRIARVYGDKVLNTGLEGYDPYVEHVLK